MASIQQHAIGLFDSGIGGLTVLKEIMRVMPNEHLIYFGDTARVPYGNKSRETIQRYSLENAQFLIQQQIKLLVIACNTASAFAIEHLRHQLSIPVIGVIEPGAEKAISVTKSQQIAILGTKGTIQSGAYQATIQQRLPHSNLISIACPLLVPLVEERLFHHPATKMIIQEYLKPIHHHAVDTLLLGCTHYPFLKHLIQTEVGNDIQLVDSASTCAEKVQQVLTQQSLINLSSNPGTHQYFVTDDSEKFKEMVEQVFDQSISNIHAINLESK